MRYLVRVVLWGGAAVLGAFLFAACTPTPPSVSSVAPDFGSPSGGNSVIISGSSFTGATAVTFGGKAATSFTVTSASQINAVAPAGTATVHITVKTSAGTSALGNSDLYRYDTQSLAPCTINWTGTAGDDNWTTAANWSPARLPANADHVCLPTGKPAVTYDGSQPIVIQTVEAHIPLTVNGGGSIELLDATAQSFSDSTVTMTGGVVSGSGTLTIANTLDWEGGAIAGSGTLAITPAAHAEIALTGGCCSEGLSGGRTLLNQGSVSLDQNSDLPLGDATTVTNAGTFTTRGGGTVFAASGSTPPVFTNTGTVTKAVDSADASIQVPFDNAGTVSVTVGTLHLSGGNSPGKSDSGSYTIASGTTLDFNGGTRTFVSGSPITGAGTLSQSGGNLAGNFTSPNTFVWSGGLQMGPGTTTIGAGHSLEIATVCCDNSSGLAVGRVLTNQGTVTLDADDVFPLGDNAIVNNVGTFNALDDTQIFSSAAVSPPRVSNSGAFAKATGSTLTSIGVPFDNSGTVSVGAGELQFGGGNSPGVSDTGGYTIGSGTTLDFNGGHRTFGAGSSITGAGTLSESGGILSGNFSDPGKFVWTSGTQTVPGTTTIPTGTTLEIETGCCNESLGSGRTLTNRGTITLDAEGGVSLSDGAVLTNAGTFNMRGDTVIEPSGQGITPARITNTGTFAKPLDTTDAQVDVPFDNAGTVRVTTGTLHLSGGNSSTGSDTGAYTIGAGSTLDFDGGNRKFATGSTITGAGTLHQTGGVLTGNFSTPTAFVWTGGSQAGPGTTTIGSGKTLEIACCAAGLTANRVLTNQGTMTVDASVGLGLGDGVVVNNAGTLSLRGGADLISTASTTQPRVSNTGTVSKPTDPADSSVDAPFDNQGTVSVAVGVLHLSAGNSPTGTDTGTVTIGTLGVLSLDGGTRTIAAGSSISGAGTLAIGGGETDLLPSATVSVGNANLSGGTIGFRLASTTSGTGYAVLHATTKVTLGGGASVSFASGYCPAFLSTYKVVTAGSVTGTFSFITSPSGTSFGASYAATSVTLGDLGGTCS